MSPREEVVERLRPKHPADEPIARAVVSTNQAERLMTVEAYLRDNNALKAEAADTIEALSTGLEELRKALERIAKMQGTAGTEEASPFTTTVGGKVTHGFSRVGNFASDIARTALTTENDGLEECGNYSRTDPIRRARTALNGASK